MATTTVPEVTKKTAPVTLTPNAVAKVPILVLMALLCCWPPQALQASDLDSKFFPPNADTKTALVNALTTAQNSNRRLMVIYQGSWCNLCPEFQRDIAAKDKSGSLDAAYVVVVTKTEDLKDLQEFAQHLDPDLKLTPDNGPLITVFDKDGSFLDSRTAARMMENGQLSSTKIDKLVERWKLLPPASDLFKAGLANVQSSSKRGIVQFGADWCKYCHMMDKFFEQSAASPVLSKYYVRILIDYERNEGAPQLAARLGENGNDGLPWWVMLDAGGTPLANSPAPQGNIGFPTEEDERVYFMSVVQSTAKGITPEELAVVNKALDDYMAKPGSK